MGLAFVALAGCSDDDDDGTRTIRIKDTNDITSTVKEALINAQSGDTIILPEGTFYFNDRLTFDGDNDGDGVIIENITITGAGRDKTILDFSLSAGGDGILIENAKGITLTDFTVQEAANNGIKLKDVDGIKIQNMGAQWLGDLDSDNGAYGFYPVECQNILIEDSYVRGSADAGIYVGQSQNIIVRNNTAIENVAGIEIENSKFADVYGNTATGNTGGILIFDLPIGNGNYGSDVRVFNNTASNNNADNFANASDNPAGVHIVPPGTGMIVLATRNVEFFNNTIENNETSGIAIADFQVAGALTETEQTAIADGWSPTPQNINMHDNVITNTGANPRGALVEDVIIPSFQSLNEGQGKMPDILYDGLGELLANAGELEAIGILPFSNSICSMNNGDATSGRLFDVNPANPDAFYQDTLKDEDGKDVKDEQGEVIILTLPNPQPMVATDLLNCPDGLESLAPAVVTINGVEYGCGKDDMNCE
ncbi:MAG: right-handed parallel beta-helix repeat-containing protein [Pseudomonadales bacterium]|nr:right-handed parallel beta-helix repeat-containing protein [Pseudomonadales bacterium]